MSCYLSIIGEDLDVDAFEKKCKLRFDKKSRKGELRHPSLKDGSRMKWSILSVIVSEADFDSLSDQIEDVKTYISNNKEQLKYIKLEKEILYATFDFGVYFNPEKPVKSVYLPPDLVAMAGDLGIGFDISLYNSLRFE